MKKFFSLFLTFAMMLSMSILAVAEETGQCGAGQEYYTRRRIYKCRCI